jgi:hypothetical protein
MKQSKGGGRNRVELLGMKHAVKGRRQEQVCIIVRNRVELLGMKLLKGGGRNRFV